MPVVSAAETKEVKVFWFFFSKKNCFLRACLPCHESKSTAIGITPHVAQNNKHRRSAIDGRTTRHAGYAISQRKRKKIEEVFGWMKSAAGFRKTRHRGTARVGWMFTLNAAAYNLIRLPKLLHPTG